MRYLKSKKGYKHKDHPDVILRFVDKAIPCSLGGVSVDVYTDDDSKVFLLKVTSSGSVDNKTKVPASAERFFKTESNMRDYIDRDVYNDAASLGRLIDKMWI